ncbi:hypothetical protein JHK84_027809 [Glycine max]|nr:hypothetical protein JHK84_027809 [Glycine max]
MNSPKDFSQDCTFSDHQRPRRKSQPLRHLVDYDMSCSMTKDTFDNCARHEIESIDVMPTNTRTPFEELNIRPCVGMEFVSIEKSYVYMMQDYLLDEDDNLEGGV